MKEKIVDLYIPNYFEKEIYKEAIYFEDKSNIAYIKIEDALELLKSIYHRYVNSDIVDYKVSGKDKLYTIHRENGSLCSIDVKNNTICFDNYDSFITYSKEELNFINDSKYLSNYEYTKGKEITISLNDYQIKLISKDTLYIPVSLFSSIFMTYSFTNLVYNGTSLFLVMAGQMYDRTTTFNESYTLKRDKELVNYNYNLLCLSLDFNFGLKKEKGIDTFDKYFIDIKLKNDLLEVDEKKYYDALSRLFNDYLNDGHSNIVTVDQNKRFFVSNFRINRFFESEAIRGYRRQFNIEENRKLEIIEDTAFLTVDHLTENAYDQLVESRSKIDDKVKNIVIDFSMCGGGFIDVTLAVLSLLLDDVSLNFYSTLTGSKARSSYHFDSLYKGFNIYCLVSNMCYSASNLVAGVLKESGKVKLIGEKTGGGSSAQVPISTPLGDILKISGTYRSSDSKEEGIIPDIVLEKAHLCDRAQILDIIRNK